MRSMRAQGHFYAVVATASLGAGASGCSLALDWDALTSGQGGQGGSGSACGEVACEPETLWAVPCHSVFITADKTQAFVTRYAKTPEPPGLYRVDLVSGSPTDAGELLKGDGFPAAGVAGDASRVVFATRDPSGSVWSVATAAPNAATQVSAGLDAFGVALTPEGDVYWVEREKKVHAVTSAGVAIDSWDIDGNPYYIAVHYEAESGGNVAYVAYNAGASADEGQVARLEVGAPSEVLFGGLTPVRGIAVKMLARPDKEVVPHLFLVTAAGAKMAWEEASGTFTVSDLGGDPGNSSVMVPGEIAVDDTHAYWALRGSDGTGGDVFRKVHHGLGTVERLGSDEQAPVGVALTDDAIYWCSSSVKGLRRLSLKAP